jgi:hypothetical protein
MSGFFAIAFSSDFSTLGNVYNEIRRPVIAMAILD